MPADRIDWTPQEERDLWRCWPDNMDAFYAAHPERNRNMCKSKISRMQRAEKEADVDALDIIPEHTVPIFESIQQQKPVDLRRAFELSKEIKDFFDERDPIAKVQHISFDTDQPICFIPVSCVHLGSRYTFYKEFEEFFYQILDIPRMFWGSMGDDIDGFIPKFYSSEAVVGQLYPPHIQRDMLESMLDELVKRDKLLFGTWSEHTGKWWETAVGENPYKRLFTSRDVPYFDGQGYLHISVGSEEYEIALAHGLSGSSIHNLLHPQGRAARFEYPNADVIINAGRHQYGISEQAFWKNAYDVGSRRSPFVWLLETGTAKAGPDKYTIRNWAQGIMEWPMVVLYPDEHKIKVSRDLDDVRYWLSL